MLQIATIDGKRTFTAFRMDGAAVDPKLSAITSANGFSNTASILAGGTKSVNARKWLRFYATDPRIDTTAQGETIDTDTDADTDTDTDTDTSTPAEG